MDGTRRNANAREVTCAVMDLDHIGPDQFAAMLARLEGYACIIHSTHSHRPWDWCMRLVMPLSSPVLAADWDRVWYAIVTAFDLPRDDKCKDTSRVFYLPSHPIGGERVYLRGEGQTLNTAALIEYARTLATAPPAHAPSTEHDLPREDTSDLPDIVSVDLHSLTDRLKELRYRKSRSIIKVDTDRHAILGRILKGTPLAIPGHLPESEATRQGISKGRGSEINKAGSLLAFAFPSGTPVDAAIEVMRPCILSMDPSSQMGLYEFKGVYGTAGLIATFADSYARSMARRQARDAEADALDRALRERLNGMLPLPPQPETAVPIDPAALPPAPPPQVPPGQGQSLRELAPAFVRDHGAPAPLMPIQGHPATELPLPAPPDPFAGWRDLIINKPDGTIQPLGENAYIILAWGEATRKTIRWNEVEKTIEVKGGPFASVPPAILDVVATDWLARFWKLQLNMNEVGHRILRMAYTNKYDPLAEYLYGLKWDGINRIDDFFVRYCDARISSLAGQNIELHINDVGRKWLTSAIARALNPGSKVDTVLILEGEQGDFKSQMLEVLGGRWYCGDTLDLGSNESKMLAAKNWLIEISELDAFMKVENVTRKKFFSLREDQFREPYAKTTGRSPRRAVFVGTYNPRGNETYFSDPSGNRRYWPIRCGQIRLRDIIRDRDQIWAQAVWYYLQFQELDRAGVERDMNPYRWWYTKAEQGEVEKQTEDRMTPSTAEVKIAEWWSAMHPAKRPAEFTIVYIAEHVLGYQPDRIVGNQSINTIIGMALGKVGFDKYKPMRNGIQQWMYYPTPALKDLPMSQGRGHLQLMTDEIAKRLPQ